MVNGAQSRYEYDYARGGGGWGDQAGGGLDRETVKTTCTFFRSCTWLVGGGERRWWWLGGNAAFADQYG